MDTATKDFLFEDNTVYETLSELKLLGNAEPSFEDPKASMGVKCLLNHYQSDDNAEIAEFVALAFVSYAGLFKVFNISKLAKWEVLKKGRFMSSLIAGEAQAIKNIAKVCSSDSYQKTKLDDRIAKENPDFDTKPLKDELGFSFNELEIPRNKTPACKSIEQNVVANDFKRSGCLINALKEHLPVF